MAVHEVEGSSFSAQNRGKKVLAVNVGCIPDQQQPCAGVMGRQ